MSMEQVLVRAVERIRSGHLSNEAQVKQSVIVPILRELDWDDINPMEFVPEFPVENRWVDYALCREVNKQKQPLIFIEAKKLGGADIKGEEQLFGYASNRGIPFLILTDGSVWNFYLSMAVGLPVERRFYRMELQRSEKIPEYAKFLEEYFRKDLVVSGKAMQAAQKRHNDNREMEEARNTIPVVWKSLLKDPDEMLRDLLAEAVEGECGTKPDLDDVEMFLLDQLQQSPAVASSPSGRAQRESLSTSDHIPAQRRLVRIVGFNFEGESVKTGRNIWTLEAVLKMFQKRDADFMERFAPQTVGRTRRLVARNRNDLFDRDDLVSDNSVELEDGWWMGTYLSKGNVRDYIKTACQIAGVKFGSDLTLIER
ncbi:MAG: hypothetical protein OXU53_06970 [Deltaproteobacteria bacterium]|nr:hypothetical protein [Deltaproteobacteria bacterium]